MRRDGSSVAPPMPAPPRRGRPPNAALAVERRRAIVAAASEAFVERGYEAAGIADIDARLAVGRGTFYRHFRSKREVLDHVVDDAIARLVAAVKLPPAQTEADDADAFFALIGTLVDRIFAAVDADPDVVRLLLLETTSVDEAMTLRLLGAVDAVTTAVAAALDRGVARGYLRGDLDTEVFGAQVLYLLVPALLRALRGGLPVEERSRYRDGVVALVAEGAVPGG